MWEARNDVIRRAMARLHDRVPEAQKEWCAAMLAELDRIEGFWKRLTWCLGGARALLWAWLRLIVKPAHGGPRRLELRLVCLYQLLFSATLAGAITWQLPRITESWKYALPVVIMCYALSAVPGILGYGLAIQDEAARVGTITFTIAHALLNYGYLQSGLARYPNLTISRIVLDAAIVVILSRPAVRREFELSSISLTLR